MMTIILTTLHHLFISPQSRYFSVCKQANRILEITGSANSNKRCNSTSIPRRTITSGHTKTKIMASSGELQERIMSLAQSYERDGYGVVENFLTSDQVESARNEAKRLIGEGLRNESKELPVFGNNFNMKSRQFLESSDKICYFLEKKAVNLDTSELKLPEEQSLAKIAHALHSLNPVFNKISCSEPVRDVFRAIGFVEPTIVQSMIIFKNPKVGGAYTPHQDASFLYSEPTDCLAGIWLALDDATPENGCLEFIPGSHKWPLARRFVRTGNTQDGENLLEWTSPPAEFDESKFVRVPVKKGDLVLIHGLVVHRSAENNSDKPRWIYTFHAYDKARSVYSDKNWLQKNVNDTFLTLKTN